jgi:hypothetical protein
MGTDAKGTPLESRRTVRSGVACTPSETGSDRTAPKGSANRAGMTIPPPSRSSRKSDSGAVGSGAVAGRPPSEKDSSRASDRRISARRPRPEEASELALASMSSDARGHRHHAGRPADGDAHGAVGDDVLADGVDRHGAADRHGAVHPHVAGEAVLRALAGDRVGADLDDADPPPRARAALERRRPASRRRRPPGRRRRRRSAGAPVVAPRHHEGSGGT